MQSKIHAFDAAVFRISIPLFFLVLGVYTVFSPAHWLTTPDEELDLRTTLSLLEGKRGAIPPLPLGFATKPGRDGKEYAQYGLGLPLAAVPWCALGLRLDVVSQAKTNRLENVNEATAAGSHFLRWWMTLFSVTLTALTLVLCEMLFRRMGLAENVSVFLAVLAAFGTILWPHGRTFFTEPLTAFCLVAAVGCFVRFRERPEQTWWVLAAGIFWAYALLTRMDTLFTAPAAAWLLCVRERDGQVRFDFDPRKILWFGLPFLAVIATIAGYNYLRFGALLSTGYEDQPEKIRFLTPLLVGLHGFLFSPGRSLFVYSPPLIFAAGGAWRLWKRDSWLCGGLILICGCYLIAMSKWQNWAGGYDWGPRHIYQVMPILILLSAAFFLERSLFDSPAKRMGWMALGLVSLFVQFLGLAADPVLTLRRTLFAGPDMPIASGFTYHEMLKQFMVYLPQFSGPVLHWQMILRNGADFLFFRITENHPGLLWLFLLPLGISAWGAWRLYPVLSQKTKISH